MVLVLEIEEEGIEDDDEDEDENDGESGIRGSFRKQRPNLAEQRLGTYFQPARTRAEKRSRRALAQRGKCEACTRWFDDGNSVSLPLSLR